MTDTPDALPQATIADIEMHVDELDIARAAEIYNEYGALVVRGLMRDYAEDIRQDIEAAAQQAISLYDQAKQIPEGWTTPDGTLWLPAPEGFDRDKQIMVIACGYKHSSAFLRSAYDPTLLDVVERVLGPNLELFLDGQCLYKEPCGGHPKMLHQDVSYFEHRFEGPCAILNYAVDTTIEKGALHVVPGSHKLGVLGHVDTFSHLGLDPEIWSLEKALPVEGNAGDAIFFHVNTIHGSPENNTDTARPVFIHRYRRADDYIVIGGTSAKNRARAEKEAEKARKDNQLGFMVRGRRTFEQRV